LKELSEDPATSTALMRPPVEMPQQPSKNPLPPHRTTPKNLEVHILTQVIDIWSLYNNYLRSEKPRDQFLRFRLLHSHRPVPISLRVCQESRAEALRHYELGIGAGVGSHLLNLRTYINYETDIVVPMGRWWASEANLLLPNRSVRRLAIDVALQEQNLRVDFLVSLLLVCQVPEHLFRSRLLPCLRCPLRWSGSRMESGKSFCLMRGRLFGSAAGLSTD